MKSREEIITDMCYTYRHDYGLNKDPNDPSWIAGMTEAERKGLWQTMAQIYDNTIAPNMDLKNGKPR
jgi:hypothetical protein